MLYQLVSLVTESIIMIPHEPDVALQNWYAFILFLSHTHPELSIIVDIDQWYKGKTNLSACLDIRRLLASKSYVLKENSIKYCWRIKRLPSFTCQLFLDLQWSIWFPIYIHAAHCCTVCPNYMAWFILFCHCIFKECRPTNNL